MKTRAAIFGVLGLIVAALFAWDDPHGSVPPVTRQDTDAVASPSGRGSTWFCAGGAVGTEVAHRVHLLTTEENAISARVTPFDGDGNALTVVSTEVAPDTTVTIDNADLGVAVTGVMVEFLAGSGVATHEQVSATGIDQEPCDTAAASTWYFGAAATELDSIAVLWLFNPFPADASVDVGASTVDGFRTPGDLAGVVIPARSSRAVSLGESIERRDRFSLSVESREGTGPVVASLTQIYTGAAMPDDAPIRRGLDLIGGQSSAATDWLMADGVGGAGLADEVVMFNPADDAVTAQLSVFPTGVEPDLLPDPIVVEVPAHRFVSVSLPDETRFPPEGVRWMSIRSDGSGVVVARVSTVLEDGGDGSAATRPSVSRGLSGSIGSRWMAEQWWFAGVGSAAADGMVLTLANPSGESIAVADVFAMVDGVRTNVADNLEVAPLSSFSLDISGSVTAATSVLVVAETPVVVEARALDGSVSDLSIVGGAPSAEGRVPLEVTVGGG